MLQLTTNQKPKTYSWLRLAMVTSLVCGLEFCASVALSYVPSILLKAGLLEQHMALIMGLGPFFGFFFCPIIGRISDNCQSRFGRRKPFILILSLIILISLALIYYSQVLLFNDVSMDANIIMPRKSFVNVFLLVFACVLLDFASQASFNPIESLLLDMCQGTDREHTCFTIYSFMNSLGKLSRCCCWFFF
jgi:Na+/melibiose symporter-like transporter